MVRAAPISTAAMATTTTVVVLSLDFDEGDDADSSVDEVGSESVVDVIDVVDVVDVVDGSGATSTVCSAEATGFVESTRTVHDPCVGRSIEPE